MARSVRFAFIVVTLMSALAGPASAQAPDAAPKPEAAPDTAPSAAPAPSPPGPVYTLAFFETAAGSHGRTAKLLRAYATATAKVEGNLGELPLQEVARPSRFALVEIWRDKAAADAHAGDFGTLRGDLRPVLTAPFDIRANAGLDVGGGAIGGDRGGGNAVYVLTHVDVFPAGKDQTIEMLKQLAAASRKEGGNLRFDVLQQNGRLNHLPLIEAWHDAAAQGAHATAEHTRAFRTKLVTLQGALYDERLYRPLH